MGPGLGRAGREAQPGIMAGRHLFEGGLDFVKEGAKFNTLIAKDVGTGGATGFEFVQGIGDDEVQIFGLKGNDLEGHTGLFADRSDVLQVFFPGAVAQKGQFVFQPDFEIECGDVVVVFDQVQGDGAVYPAGKPHYDRMISRKCLQSF